MRWKARPSALRSFLPCISCLGSCENVIFDHDRRPRTTLIYSQRTVDQKPILEIARYDDDGIAMDKEEMLLTWQVVVREPSPFALACNVPVAVQLIEPIIRR